MNSWVEKSIKLAASRGYLDKLSSVYPINPSAARDIDNEEKKKIKTALENRNAKILISELLKLDKFPIDDPYIGFFRKDKSAINRNPKTVNRIAEKLFKMGYENVVLGASKEKIASRRFGQMFRNYLPKLGLPVLNKESFIKHKGRAVLAGGDEALKQFAKDNLHYRGEKGLDLVLKTRKHFVVGETKFITTGGGTQDKSFREAISFVKKKNKYAIQIAVLDGVLWILNDKNRRSRKRNLYSSIIDLKKNEIVLSILFLRDFINSLE